MNPALLTNKRFDIFASDADIGPVRISFRRAEGARATASASRWYALAVIRPRARISPSHLLALTLAQSGAPSVSRPLVPLTFGFD